MTTFNKEQLIERCNEAIASLKHCNGTAERKGLACFEIALAALTAEPTPAPELKMAHLINKFYERYPLDTFKIDSDRSEALGYFMAGAELQCFGEFINYSDLIGDE